MLRFTFFIFLIAITIPGCNPRKQKAATATPPGYDELQKIIEDKKNPARKRYEASVEAEKLAFVGVRQDLQEASVRTRGGILVDMDSLRAALPVYHQLRVLTAQKKDSLIHAVALTNIAYINGELSAYDSAIHYYQLAIPVFFKNKDSLKAIQSKINLGIAFKNAGKFDDAFAVSIEAANQLKQLKDGEEKAAIYTTLGNTLKDLRRFDDALHYHLQALDIRRQIKDSTGIAGSLNNIGNVYKLRGQYDTAFSFYFQSLVIKRKKSSARSLATTLDNLSEVCMNLVQKNEAVQYAREALRLRNEMVDKEGWMTSAGRLVEIYIEENKNDSALSLALKIDSLARAPSYQKRRLANALFLEEIYSNLNQPVNALQSARLARSVKDSLFSGEMSEKIASLDIQYRSKEQKLQIEQSKKDNARKSKQIEDRNLFILLLAILILSLSISVYLLINANRQRTQAQEETTRLMVELNHRTKNNLQIISSMLALQVHHSDNPQVTGALEIAAERIQSVGLLHRQLYGTKYSGFVKIAPFLYNLSNNILNAFGKQQDPTIKITGTDISLSADDAIYLGLIVNEALTNIYKYTLRTTTTLVISLSITEKENRYTITIRDDGAGWQQAGVTSSEGIGLQLIRMFSSRIEANTSSYRDGNNNIFEISFEKPAKDHE